MNKIIDSFKILLSNEELMGIAIQLEKSYAPFKVKFNGWDIAYNTFPKVAHPVLKQYEKIIEPHQLFNEIILNYCGTERVVKYHLAKRHLGNDDEVCIFEFNINDSRLDFGVINGHSYAYEIKTERDTLYRLEKQITDYKKAFEYITVVTHEKHLKKVKSSIKKEIGIVSYSLINNECSFKQIRIPTLNKGFQKAYQLDLLRSDELHVGLLNKGTEVSKIPTQKISKKRKLNRLYNKDELNEFFKQSVKLRQTEKWSHVKTKFDILHPIDLQECYSNLFDPSICYNL